MESSGPEQMQQAKGAVNTTISTKLHFPARLYQVIEIEDPSVIAWEISGKSFRIVDSKRFRAETIPKYFRHGNMASIQRQLNLYGFRCTNRIDEKGVFCHPNFIRGEYDMVRNIRRKKTWPTKRKPKGGEDPAPVPAPVVAPVMNGSSSSSSTLSVNAYSRPTRASYHMPQPMMPMVPLPFSAPIPLPVLPAREPMLVAAPVPAQLGPVPLPGPFPEVSNFVGAGGLSPAVLDDYSFTLSPVYVTSNGERTSANASPMPHLPECSSPMSGMLSEEYLLDFFDDKTIDNMIMINNALDRGDFDQNLLNLFASDDFAEEIN